MSDKLYIVIPAYNEEANIEQIIVQWHLIVEKVNKESRLVIFNDGSQDKTFKIMKDLERNFPQFVPISKSNSGHGSTCLFAYDYALNCGADYIFQTDSDGQTNPDEFINFWDKRNEFDFIIGYRNKRQDGSSRVIVTKTLKIILWLIFGTHVKDCNTPFRLMNAKQLKVFLQLIPKDFFLSNAIISMLVVKYGVSHIWLPITFKPRQGGINSINIKRIIKIGFKAILDFYKLKSSLKKYDIKNAN